MTLEGTLEATVSTDAVGPGAVRFAFTVANGGDDPATLRFADAVRAEFVVEEGGREVWRFTDGRAFAQILGEETLASDAETTYEAEWLDPRPGEYTAVAELRARAVVCEAGTSLEIGD